MPSAVASLESPSVLSVESPSVPSPSVPSASPEGTASEPPAVVSSSSSLRGSSLLIWVLLVVVDAPRAVRLSFPILPNRIREHHCGVSTSPEPGKSATSAG